MTSIPHIIFVALGAIFLAASISLNFGKRKEVPGDLAGRWRLLTCLMIFFLSGYCVYLYLQLSRRHFPLDLLISLVFLGAPFLSTWSSVCPWKPSGGLTA